MSRILVAFVFSSGQAQITVFRPCTLRCKSPAPAFWTGLCCEVPTGAPLSSAFGGSARFVFPRASVLSGRAGNASLSGGASPGTL